MGSCVSCATTPTSKADHIVECLDFSLATKTEKRLSLCSVIDKKEESVPSTKLKTEANVAYESVSKENEHHVSNPRNDSRPLSSSTYIVPYTKTLQYQIRNSRQLIPIRQPESYFFQDTMNSSCHTEFTLPGASSLQTSLQSDTNESLKFPHDTNMKEVFLPKPRFQEKSELSHTTAERITSGLLSTCHPNSNISLNDSTADDIENADLLLSELKDLEKSLKESQKIKVNSVYSLERPKTRRGLCSDSAEADKSNPHNLVRVNGGFAQKKHAKVPQTSTVGDFSQSVTNRLHFNDVTVMSSSHEEIKNRNLPSRESGAFLGELAYNEAELQMINEIENEFNTS